MVLWSVIVYGRTKEADYRFLAIPDDFGTEEQNWARKYIHGTTVKREELPGNPRWSLFKNHKHCVFGVTCMVKELIGSERGYEYMTKGPGGRSLHIFVGYVAQINEDFNPLKILPDLENLEFFKPKSLLISLEKSWHLKNYQLIGRKIDEYPYNLELNYSRVTESTGYTNKSIPPEFIPCLEGENRTFICPDSLEYRQNLWENCCKFFDYPHQHTSLSLCLGLPRKKDVLEGPFSNATTFDTTQNIKFSKLPKRNSNVINEPSKIREPDNRNASKTTHNSSYSISRRRLPIRMVLLISISIGLVLLVIWNKYTLAIQIFMSLLVGLYVQHVSGK
ncbi:hypothetical protein [Okeania sp. KiyG1]|uniref:hypothetical protein n=1 Tax=Okeania sp. KiyG1 TaxID=2720165 RepID=UPI001924B6CD|nr:hypothetical protein [Okeania sp. KiyG1]GGA17384.1 hypothetical protein CYANOKiyG1_31600 [Okeania sp. KiyG1]